MYDDYSDKGVTFILVVGSDKQYQPATPAYVAEYAAEKGYQDGWVMVSDPGYAQIDNRILDDGGEIPFHVILGKDLILHVASAQQKFVWMPEMALINLLKEQGLYP